jgi:amino acid transporter
MKLLNKLKILNILLPILMFILLLVFKLSEKTIYLFVMTLIIGWALPYFVLLITGFAQVKNLFHKLGLTLNILSIPLCIIMLFLIISIYEPKQLIFIIEYSIIIIMNILNIIYYAKYLKDHPDEEIEKIKKAKKNNNGAVV